MQVYITRKPYVKQRTSFVYLNSAVYYLKLTVPQNWYYLSTQHRSCFTKRSSQNVPLNLAFWLREMFTSFYCFLCKSFVCVCFNRKATRADTKQCIILEHLHTYNLGTHTKTIAYHYEVTRNN